MSAKKPHKGLSSLASIGSANVSRALSLSKGASKPSKAQCLCASRGESKQYLVWCVRLMRSKASNLDRFSRRDGRRAVRI